MTPEPINTTADLAGSLASLSEYLGPVLEAVKGYRAQAMASDFSPMAAEEMALEYHRLLFEALRGRSVNGSSGGAP